MNFKAIGFIVLTAGGTIITLFSSISHIFNKDTRQWLYGLIYETSSYNEGHTDILDQFVVKYCIVKHNKIKDNYNSAPNIGSYKYKIPVSNESITIEKNHRVLDNRDVFEYKIYAKNKKALVDFVKIIHGFTENNQSVSVQSIDTSRDTPGTICIKKSCGSMHDNQKQAINLIISEWNPKNKFNTKIILYGQRGLGKTYTARLIKKYIQDTYKDIYPILFDDFNPSSIGVNVNKMILNQATSTTPVILVINEIDTIYHKVVNGPEPYDSRLQHSRNIGYFHNMLDDIGDCHYVIAIYTTEKDVSDLHRINEYKSFMRLGRVDFFINLTADDAIKKTHNDI